MDGSTITELNLVTGTFFHSRDPAAAAWVQRASVVTRTTPDGTVKIAVVFRRNRLRIPSGFHCGSLVSEPPETKCCQPWHDPGDGDIYCGDSATMLTVRSMTTLRRTRIYNSLVRIRCIICNRQSPGLPHRGYRVLVSERDEMVSIQLTVVLCGRR